MLGTFFIHKAQRILTETSWFAKKTDRALIIVKFTVISKQLQKTILHFEHCMAQMQKHNIHTMSQNIMTATSEVVSILASVRKVGVELYSFSLSAGSKITEGGGVGKCCLRPLLRQTPHSLS